MTRMGRPPGPQGPHRPSAPTLAHNILARHGFTLVDADRMTDEELLALPGFGQRSLDVIRDRGTARPTRPGELGARCPHCGEALTIVVRQGWLV